MENAGNIGYNFSNLDNPPPYEPPPQYDGQQYKRDQNFRQPYPGQHQDAGQHPYTVQQQYGLQPYGVQTHVQSPTTVIVSQPEVVTTVSLPPDYLVPSVFACLCCFPLTGIFAIYYATVANSASASGELDAAHRYSNSARSLMITSIVLGVMWIGIFIALWRLGVV
ncbi:PRT1B-like protein [Mya arenaria]|uniref:PRT1B-like protein n=1 Tax=Mya arenaria TaxID=6604 RepID=A0ABY7DPQ4_MYAAR|nr:trafficking regulator of GLUT4 1-like [Mya arenaria]WAQ99384.1 PRT1B-like protein [Mya arenaria]